MQEPPNERQIDLSGREYLRDSLPRFRIGWTTFELSSAKLALLSLILVVLVWSAFLSFVYLWSPSPLAFFLGSLAALLWTIASILYYLAFRNWMRSRLYELRLQAQIDYLSTRYKEQYRQLKRIEYRCRKLGIDPDASNEAAK
jgi:hypothetical protein